MLVEHIVVESDMKHLGTYIALAAALAASGCSTRRVMDEIMHSWDGAQLDAVVAQWGMPSRQMKIGERTMYAWDENSVTVIPTQTHSNAFTDAMGNVQVTTYTSGGNVIEGSCSREVTVDASNIVVATGWRGNDCPFAEWFEYAEWRRKGT